MPHHFRKRSGWSWMARVLGIVVVVIVTGGAALAQDAGPFAPRLVLGHYHTTIVGYRENQPPAERWKQEVQSAVAGGLDGFFTNSFYKEQTLGMLEAAAQAADELGYPHFKLAPSFDFGSNEKGRYSADPRTGAQIQDAVRQWMKNPHCLMINGKPVFTTFLGQNKAKIFNGDWWRREVTGPLHDQGVEVLFITDGRLPEVDTPPTDANMTRLWSSWRMAAGGIYNFASGAHIWPGIAEKNAAEETLASVLHAQGGIVMSTLKPSFYSLCHSDNGYVETEGGLGLEQQWESIITRQKAELVEICTWNDWTEGSHIQPTRLKADHIAYLELEKYYISWYHTLKKPTVTRDALFYFYRRTAKDAVTAGTGCPGPVTPNTLDAIYLTAALTQPAQVTVEMAGQTQSQTLPAGITHFTIPFVYGTDQPVFRIVRAGTAVAQGAGPYPIVRSLEPNPVDANVYTGWIMADGLTSDTWTPDHPVQWFDE